MFYIKAIIPFTEENRMLASSIVENTKSLFSSNSASRENKNEETNRKGAKRQCQSIFCDCDCKRARLDTKARTAEKTKFVRVKSEGDAVLRSYNKQLKRSNSYLPKDRFNRSHDAGEGSYSRTSPLLRHNSISSFSKSSSSSRSITPIENSSLTKLTKSAYAKLATSQDDLPSLKEKIKSFPSTLRSYDRLPNIRRHKSFACSSYLSRNKKEIELKEEAHSSDEIELKEEAHSSDVIETKEEAHSSDVNELKEAYSSDEIEMKEEAHSSDVIETKEEAYSSDVIETKEEAHSSDVNELKEAHSSDEIEMKEEAHSSDVIETKEEAHSSDINEFKEAHSSDVIEMKQEAHSSDEMEWKEGAHTSDVIELKEEAHTSEENSTLMVIPTQDASVDDEEITDKSKEPENSETDSSISLNISKTSETSPNETQNQRIDWKRCNLQDINKHLLHLHARMIRMEISKRSSK